MAKVTVVTVSVCGSFITLSIFPASLNAFGKQIWQNCPKCQCLQKLMLQFTTRIHTAATFVKANEKKMQQMY